VDAATFAARFGLAESEKGKGRGGTVWGRMPHEGGKERGGWYGVLTGCGGRPVAGCGRGGGGARSVRDRGGSETLIGEGPTTVTGGDSFV
jgi:hypothetical protein